MGEYAQPVVGMKSCLELAGAHGDGAPWTARVWFVVKEARVHISSDNVLIPYVELAVEAREQVMRGGRLEDARFTKPDHPLVQYADQFTHNFNLIAERKSVIFHLRELAKATCLAKFLLDANITLQDSWFQLADAMPELPSPRTEIPQMWTTHATAKICEDGSLDAHMHSISGGVDLDMDRFNIAVPARVSSSPSSEKEAALHRRAPHAGARRPSLGPGEAGAAAGSLCFRKSRPSAAAACRVAPSTASMGRCVRAAPVSKNQ